MSSETTLLHLDKRGKFKVLPAGRELENQGLERTYPVLLQLGSRLMLFGLLASSSRVYGQVTKKNEQERVRE
jgi:hypothetical protein